MARNAAKANDSLRAQLLGLKLQIARAANYRGRAEELGDDDLRDLLLLLADRKRKALTRAQFRVWKRVCAAAIASKGALDQKRRRKPARKR